MAITTQDIRKTATTAGYAAAGAADLTAEKIGQFVTEAPERFEQLRNTDPKAVQERVTKGAKEAQAQVTAKFTEIVESIDTDVKKVGQQVQDLALRGVGQAVSLAAAAGDGYGKLAARGREAVKTWRGEAAEELSEIAVAVEPDAGTAAPADNGGAQAGAQDAEAKPAAARRTTTARKPAAKKTEG
ncbi:hypothetical protein LKL35_24660 [Streptomyces sp. ET3-23]|uniref:hypothetical protein n=1 Tax=Streptomyces sp. ET3-23 TaxID=2885643 RepID=UPI001D112823|nr:hypothetical protein [Streptomyces sp. ET3-23]MCC2278593.1 hypothetical protein [Streptomyces sp. ET3-23]